MRSKNRQIDYKKSRLAAHWAGFGCGWSARRNQIDQGLLDRECPTYDDH